MPQAMSKPVTVTYLPLTTSQDMHDAMEQALAAIGYYGVITTNQAGEWSITLSGPGNARIDAAIGQVLIWNGTSLSVLSQTDFADKYDPL